MSSIAPYDDAVALLEAANLGVQIRYPNVTWQNPNPPATWIDFDIIGDTLEPIELTGGAWKEEGRIFCHVMTPIGAGSRDSRILAKAIANAFRGLGPRNVVYYNASIGAGMVPDENKAWWALTVIVEYRYQDFVSS